MGASILHPSFRIKYSNIHQDKKQDETRRIGFCNIRRIWIVDSRYNLWALCNIHTVRFYRAEKALNKSFPSICPDGRSIVIVTCKYALEKYYPLPKMKKKYEKKCVHMTTYRVFKNNYKV